MTEMSQLSIIQPSYPSIESLSDNHIVSASDRDIVLALSEPSTQPGRQAQKHIQGNKMCHIPQKAVSGKGDG